jgi:hypothetical protein
VCENHATDVDPLRRRGQVSVLNPNPAWEAQGNLIRLRMVLDQSKDQVDPLASRVADGP